MPDSVPECLNTISAPAASSMISVAASKVIVLAPPRSITPVAFTSNIPQSTLTSVAPFKSIVGAVASNVVPALTSR